MKTSALATDEFTKLLAAPPEDQLENSAMATDEFTKLLAAPPEDQLENPEMATDEFTKLLDAPPEDQLGKLLDAPPEDLLAELALAIRTNEPERIKMAVASYSNCARRWTIHGAASRPETMLVPTPPPRRTTIGCMPRDQPSSRWRRRRYREAGSGTLKPPWLRRVKLGAEENVDPQQHRPAPSMDTFVTRRRPLDDKTPGTGETGRDESCRSIHSAAPVDSPKTFPRPPRPPSTRAKELRRSGGGLTNLFPTTSERPKT